jgi:hypothetical protein
VRRAERRDVQVTLGDRHSKIDVPTSKIDWTYRRPRCATLRGGLRTSKIDVA